MHGQPDLSTQGSVQDGHAVHLMFHSEIQRLWFHYCSSCLVAPHKRVLESLHQIFHLRETDQTLCLTNIKHFLNFFPMYLQTLRCLKLSLDHRKNGPSMIGGSIPSVPVFIFTRWHYALCLVKLETV